MNKTDIHHKAKPWSWIPTLYFAEGIPYFIVNNISVIMFNNMGMSKADMALYTSLLYLPWVIKPLWSPFVDIIRTKRWWIVTMQIIMAVSFFLLALTLPSPSPEVIAEGHAPVSLFVVTLLIFYLTAIASATHDIAADGFYMIALDSGQQSIFVGIRSTFYRLSSIFGQGVLVVIAGLLETKLGDIPKAWSITLIISAVIFASITLWHTLSLPRPREDSSRELDAAGIFKEFGRTFLTFFQKKGVIAALLFMLLYRLPEAFLVKMMNPFLLNSAQQGGLGLSTEAVGLVYGTAGVAALTVGGILGGIFASKHGLKKSMWLMAASLTLPCLCFVFLSLFQPSNIWVIGSCVVLDQFGYGFGFTAYMLYLIYFSEGEFKTAHYSLCTAFMALSMMIPGMVAGYLQQWLGYTGFFIMVMICCLVTVAVTMLVKVDPGFGKRETA
ncbi:MAG: MFS transporter [Bacteroidales bacterium]|nr:MFS transporter [Bacteroidales bacterium]MDD5912194.1 MFS transporter [Bacteroidales bacterium]